MIFNWLLIDKIFEGEKQENLHMAGDEFKLFLQVFFFKTRLYGRGKIPINPFKNKKHFGKV